MLRSLSKVSIDDEFYCDGPGEEFEGELKPIASASHQDEVFVYRKKEGPAWEAKSPALRRMIKFVCNTPADANEGTVSTHSNGETLIVYPSECLGALIVTHTFAFRKACRSSYGRSSRE